VALRAAHMCGKHAPERRIFLVWGCIIAYSGDENLRKVSISAGHASEDNYDGSENEPYGNAWSFKVMLSRFGAGSSNLSCT
jgi:hypothetical protein